MAAVSVHNKTKDDHSGKTTTIIIATILSLIF